MKYKNKISGFSLIELLIVIGIFSVLAVVTTQIVVVSLRNSSKSERLVEVRENVDFAFNFMERQIRNAESINCPNDLRVDYVDENEQNASLICNSAWIEYVVNAGTPQRLTSSDITITCSGVFTCETDPDAVTMTITAVHSATTGASGAEITTQSRILLRSYGIDN